MLTALLACSGKPQQFTAAAPAPSPRLQRTPGGPLVRPAFDPGQLQRTELRRVGNRVYYLFAPPHSDRPVPLILVLHGLNTGPGRVASDSRFTSYAAGHELALAYGVGLSRAWNAGNCCRGDKADDTGYLVSVVFDAEHHVRIDPRRIYVVGFSNGGMMAFRAVCERPDVFAAGGVMSGRLVTSCRPRKGIRGRPLHIRQFQGLADSTTPPAGGPNKLLHMDLPPIRSEVNRLPARSELDITLLPTLGHEWATTANSGTDATSEFSEWLLQRHL